MKHLTRFGQLVVALLFSGVVLMISALPAHAGGIWADSLPKGGIWADNLPNGGIWADNLPNGGIWADSL
ncbi:MAG: hypothetical protein IAE81_05210, partial [Caldilineaceae bacterium]|nr:hypothetical protein [Caldilineaceae bacterium]